MTPHEKAMKSALRDRAINDSLESSIQTYLTTLLDSPEMVEKLATVAKKYYDDNKRKDYRLYNAFTTKEERKLIAKEAWNNLITAVIAAIKKEAGI